MRDNLAHAADHFGLVLAGEPVYGWRLRSIGSRAYSQDGDRWLRVVSQELEWAQGDHWTGTLDANTVTGIAKPRVLDVYEWSEFDWRNQRAEVMTLLSGKPCSPTDVLRTDPDLSDTWWEHLAQALDQLSRVPTSRVNADQAKVAERITERFGPNADTTVTRWETVHGDLHWSNLFRPQFGLLDWELWGRGPEGTDAATLYCFSLARPPTAERVRALFADKLDSRGGRVAQLCVIARLLRRIDGGDFPDLADPLAAHAETLLRR
ncbi:aminoglycoside phosphotransferase [Herbihabitans rhizosphaerae]|nr:aminoglycoside phosphotransferase [Herbihabitans rhizosphaerae]